MSPSDVAMAADELQRATEPGDVARVLRTYLHLDHGQEEGVRELFQAIDWSENSYVRGYDRGHEAGRQEEREKVSQAEHEARTARARLKRIRDSVSGNLTGALDELGGLLKQVEEAFRGD